MFKAKESIVEIIPKALNYKDVKSYYIARYNGISDMLHITTVTDEI